MQITDFFDSSTDVNFPYQQYYVLPRNIIRLPVGNGGASPYARIKKFELYALPRFSNAQVSQASALVQYALPVITVGTTGLEGGGAAAVKTTLLTPTSVSDWVLVGEWNEETLQLTSQSLAANVNGLTCCGALTVRDPDDMVTTSEVAIQFMARVTFAQALPSITTVSGSVPVASTANVFTTVDSSVEPSDLTVMVEAVSVSKVE